MKKNALRLLCLVFVLMLGLLPAITASAATKVTYYYVTTQDGKPLNLRSEPRTGDNILAKLDYRTKVEFLGLCGDSNWSLINVEIAKNSWVKGYVMTKFLTKKDPGPYEAENVGPTYEDVDAAVKALKVCNEPYAAYIKTKNAGNYVHLRWIPNTSARYIDRYLANEEVLVLAESKTWAQVQIVRTGYVGFILKNNVAPISE